MKCSAASRWVLGRGIGRIVRLHGHMRRDKTNREANPESALTIRLFGGMAIVDSGGVDYLPRSRKTRAMVAMLTLTAPRSTQRSQLTALLWSQRGIQQGRASLRQAVHELQWTLGSAWNQILVAERHSLSIDLRGVAVDALDAVGVAAPRTELLTLFEDGFLEDLGGLDPAFDIWLSKERRRMVAIARIGAEAFLEERQPREATILAARSLLRLDPANDGAWRALIEAHIEAGDRAAARFACEQWGDAMGLAPDETPPAEMAAFLSRIRFGSDYRPPISGRDGVAEAVTPPDGRTTGLSQADGLPSGGTTRNSIMRNGVARDRAIPNQTNQGGVMLDGVGAPGPTGDRPGSGRAVPDEAIPDGATRSWATPGAVTGNGVMPDRAPSGQGMPGGSGPSRTTPDLGMPDAAMPARGKQEGDAPKRAIPGGAAPDGRMPYRTMPGAATRDRAMAQTTTSTGRAEDRLTPDRAMPGGALSDRIMPDGVLPGRAVPEGGISDGMVPDGTVPDDGGRSVVSWHKDVNATVVADRNGAKSNQSMPTHAIPAGGREPDGNSGREAAARVLDTSTAPWTGEEPRRSGLRLGIREMRVIGADVDQALSPGLAEEVTTALSRFRWISCVSGSSLAAIAGEAGESGLRWPELDLDLLLDGTIQRAGERVRITVRLLDMRAGEAVIWANRFDQDASDTLTVQDRVAAAIVAQVDPLLLLREGERAATRDPRGVLPRDLVLQAVPAIYRMDRLSFHAAGALLEAALRADPACTDALAWYAYWHLFLVGQGWADDPDAATRRAGELADTAVAMDPNDARALTLAGHVRGFLLKRPSEAAVLHERAISLNPNLAIAWCFSGFTLTYMGDHATALVRMAKAIELSPSDPHLFFFQAAIIMPHLLLGEYEEAAAAGRKAIELNPWFSSSFKGCLAALGHLGLTREATSVRSRLAKLEPNFTVRDAIARSPMSLAADIERYADGLRRAGLQEW